MLMAVLMLASAGMTGQAAAQEAAPGPCPPHTTQVGGAPLSVACNIRCGVAGQRGFVRVVTPTGRVMNFPFWCPKRLWVPG